MKIKLFFLFLLFSIFGISMGYGQTSPLDLQKKVEKTIKAGQKSQEKADVWGEERTKLLNQIREQKNMKVWLAHQEKKYRIYIEEQEKRIAELERRKKENERIKMNLEPFLDDLAVQMEEFIKNDLPFLPDERQKRIAFVKSSLNDYRLSLGEKTKRVFEALQVEASYGATVEKTEASVNIKGSPVLVQLLRIGRTALFYQTPDRKQAGWFNQETRAWESLDSKYIREMTSSMDMAEKKRTPVLLDLPVGRAVQ